MENESNQEAKRSVAPMQFGEVKENQKVFVATADMSRRGLGFVISKDQGTGNVTVQSEANPTDTFEVVAEQLYLIEQHFTDRELSSQELDKFFKAIVNFTDDRNAQFAEKFTALGDHVTNEINKLHALDDVNAKLIAENDELKSDLNEANEKIEALKEKHEAMLSQCDDDHRTNRERERKRYEESYALLSAKYDNVGLRLTRMEDVSTSRGLYRLTTVILIAYLLVSHYLK